LRLHFVSVWQSFSKIWQSDEKSDSKPKWRGTTVATMHVSLAKELVNVIKRKASSGMYNNTSGVVREAIIRIDENDCVVLS